MSGCAFPGAGVVAVARRQAQHVASRIDVVAIVLDADTVGDAVVEAEDDTALHRGGRDYTLKLSKDVGPALSQGVFVDAAA